MPEDRMENKPPVSSPASSGASYIDAQHQLPPASDVPRSKSRWQRPFVWVVLLLTFGLIFWLVLRHRADTQSSASSSRRGATGPVTITTVVAQKGNIGVYLDAIGTVTPIYTDSITSQVTGLVSEVHYQEGQLVRKGQTLIDIDSRPFEAQL